MLTWENGPSIGGSPIINYEIWFKKPTDDTYAQYDASTTITSKSYAIH